MSRKDEIGEVRDDLNLAEVLRNPEVTKAINTAVDAWAKNRPQETKFRFRVLHLGIAFSSLVLFTVGFLGYLGVLSKDVTGSLIGALIGYWFGRYQGKKE